METMITIYHLNMSRSERIIWLMEELGLEYKLEKFQREPSMEAPASLRAIHPLGKAPVIRDGDAVLIESGAIVEYIIQRHGGGKLAVPVNSPDYARYLQWMHFAEGSAMAQFLLHLFLGGFVPGVDQSAAWVVLTKQRTTNLLKYVDSELGVRPYFAGQAFTAADLMMMFPFFIARNFMQLDLTPYPNIVNYLKRIEARPAYQKAMALANPPA
jgi:glutathione S-transferase